MLPSDGHVHSEWSWDALDGSMMGACRRALEVGLTSIAFTEHADFTAWTIPAAAIATMPAKYQAMVRPDGTLLPPCLDLAGYLAAVQECRARFPALRVLSGVELGEPHWHPADVQALLKSGAVDRRIGSVHSLTDGQRALVVERLHGLRSAAELLRAYLVETWRMVEESDAFEILGHLDYPVRSWPATGPAFSPEHFEEEFRAVLRSLARSDRVLEVNTAVPLDAVILRWWRDCGGQAIAFGSDAHEAEQVGRGFARISALAESCGFRPGRRPHDHWPRG
jgi:histidinol-phosphatase (PHP family)